MTEIEGASMEEIAKAASMEAISSLLLKDVLTIETLVREMEMYLTSTDHILRARSILLLAEVLTNLAVKPLSDATAHTLIEFFSERLADWRALRGALVGCLAMVRRKSSGGMVFATDAKAVMQSLLKNVQVQALAQHDRKLYFELLECLIERYPDAIASLGDFLIYGICEAIDGEKDPCCLKLTFHIVEVLVQLFPDPSGQLASFSGDLFEILGCYFPIHFTHCIYRGAVRAEITSEILRNNAQYLSIQLICLWFQSPGEEAEVKRDDLSMALMLAFSSTPNFEPFVIPLLLEKLSSSLPSAKLDSLKYLSSCTFKYGAERMGQHARTIWSSLKDTIDASLEHQFSFWVGLQGISLDKDPHSLSGGYKRRLALAIPLVQVPDLLILDEPLAGLGIGNKRVSKSQLSATISAGYVLLLVDTRGSVMALDGTNRSSSTS